MKLTYLGHASVLVEFGGKKLLFDPFISANELAKNVDIDAIDADYILITHGHQDHILDVERIAKNTGARIISNFEIVTYFGNLGIEGHPMNHGGSWDFDFGKVKYVNAIHSSSFPDGSYAGNPGGFVIWNDNNAFYFAGDTALTMDMKLIPMTCPKLDFCILPVGDNFTMGMDEALLASDFVECSKVVACHYDTFGYIVVDKNSLKQTFEAKNKDLIFIDIGEAISL
jgi:L-ascorbate metabolism protein UlaG (beta-lactamase superfamily)